MYLGQTAAEAATTAPTNVPVVPAKPFWQRPIVIGSALALFLLMKRR